jgi:hypothetical protein
MRDDDCERLGVRPCGSQCSTARLKRAACRCMVSASMSRQSVWLRGCVCAHLLRVCIHARYMFTCANVCPPVSPRSMSPTHRRCAAQSPGKFAVVGSRKFSRFEGRDLMVEGSRYLSTSDEVSRYSTVKSDLPLKVAAISDLQRWTVGDSGTTQHQIPVIPMDITVTYRSMID